MNSSTVKRLDKDKMPCNKPRRSPRKDKTKVVKACQDGEEKLVHFGDPDMPIRKDEPARRKSFRARHNCDDKKDKLTAGYWSCKAW
jgi:hypothetical protein